MFLSCPLVAAYFCALGILVAPTPSTGPLLVRQGITDLSPAQIAAFKPFTFFAGAGYCSASKTLAWTCGGTPKQLDLFYILNNMVCKQQIVMQILDSSL